MVLRARDQHTGREVAIKMVLGTLDRTRRERFQREAEITGALSHPGIVRVHSAGIGPGERPYIAYELVDGSGLDDVLAKAPRRRRLELVRDVARALGYAHAQGVVHRDVKPENVLVDRQGRVRVADFGLAAAGDLERLTRTGTIVGTPSYMAPEQITGVREAIGAWSDVWSLGVLLYLALTDALPFEAENLISLSAQIAMKDPTPPRSVDPTIPRDVEAVCLKALSRTPAERYQDGEALAVDLDHALRGEQVSAVRPPRFGRAARPLLWATPIVLSLGAVATVFALAPAPPEVVAPTTIATASPKRTPGVAPTKPTPATRTEPAPPRAWSFTDPPPPVVGSTDIEQLGELAKTEAMPMRLIGNAYMKGDGVAVSPRNAAMWWYRAAEAGDVDAMVRLGKILHTSAAGVPADDAQAERFLEQAATRGSSEAMQRLGELYTAGPLRDDVLAVRWLRRAVDGGELQANFLLARQLLDGRGDLRGDEADRAACKLLRGASDKGHAGAMFLLGRLIMNGRGHPQDTLEGTALIDRAAQAGNVAAAEFMKGLMPTGQD